MSGRKRNFSKGPAPRSMVIFFFIRQKDERTKGNGVSMPGVSGIVPAARARSGKVIMTAFL